MRAVLNFLLCSLLSLSMGCVPLMSGGGGSSQHSDYDGPTAVGIGRVALRINKTMNYAGITVFVQAKLDNKTYVRWGTSDSEGFYVVEGLPRGAEYIVDKLVVHTMDGGSFTENNVEIRNKDGRSSLCDVEDGDGQNRYFLAPQLHRNAQSMVSLPIIVMPGTGKWSYSLKGAIDKCSMTKVTCGDVKPCVQTLIHATEIGRMSLDGQKYQFPEPLADALRLGKYPQYLESIRQEYASMADDYYAPAVTFNVAEGDLKEAELFLRLGEAFQTGSQKLREARRILESARSEPAFRHPETAKAIEAALDKVSDLTGSEKREERIAELRKWSVRFPYSSEIYERLGDEYRYMKQYDQAVDSYLNALKNNPHSSAANKGLYNVYGKQKRYDQAIEHATAFLRYYPYGTSTLNNTSRFYRLKGDFANALKYADTSIEYLPKSTTGHYQRYLVMVKQQNWTGMIDELEVLVSLEPDSVKYNNLLGWYLSVSPDPGLWDGDRAVSVVTKACIKDEWKSSYLIDTLAAAYARSGDCAKAADLQNQAISLLKKKEGERYQGYLDRLALYKAGKPYTYED